MVVNKYTFIANFKGDGDKTSVVASLADDICAILKPREGMVSVECTDEVAKITVHSATKLKKGVRWRTAVSESLQFKYHDDFDKLRYVLNDEELPGFTLFHISPSELINSLPQPKSINPYIEDERLIHSPHGAPSFEPQQAENKHDSN